MAVGGEMKPKFGRLLVGVDGGIACQTEPENRMHPSKSGMFVQLACAVSRKDGDWRERERKRQVVCRLSLRFAHFLLNLSRS